MCHRTTPLLTQAARPSTFSSVTRLLDVTVQNSSCVRRIDRRRTGRLRFFEGDATCPGRVTMVAAVERRDSNQTVHKKFSEPAIRHAAEEAGGGGGVHGRGCLQFFFFPTWVPDARQRTQNLPDRCRRRSLRIFSWRRCRFTRSGRVGERGRSTPCGSRGESGSRGELRKGGGGEGEGDRRPSRRTSRSRSKRSDIASSTPSPLEFSAFSALSSRDQGLASGVYSSSPSTPPPSVSSRDGRGCTAFAVGARRAREPRNDGRTASDIGRPRFRPLVCGAA